MSYEFPNQEDQESVPPGAETIMDALKGLEALGLNINDPKPQEFIAWVLAELEARRGDNSETENESEDGESGFSERFHELTEELDSYLSENRELQENPHIYEDPKIREILDELEKEGVTPLRIIPGETDINDTIRLGKHYLTRDTLVDDDIRHAAAAIVVMGLEKDDKVIRPAEIDIYS